MALGDKILTEISTRFNETGGAELEDRLKSLIALQNQYEAIQSRIASNLTKTDAGVKGRMTQLEAAKNKTSEQLAADEGILKAKVEQLRIQEVLNSKIDHATFLEQKSTQEVDRIAKIRAASTESELAKRAELQAMNKAYRDEELAGIEAARTAAAQLKARDDLQYFARNKALLADQRAQLDQLAVQAPKTLGELTKIQLELQKILGVGNRPNQFGAQEQSLLARRAALLQQIPTVAPEDRKALSDELSKVNTLVSQYESQLKRANIAVEEFKKGHEFMPFLQDQWKKFTQVFRRVFDALVAFVIIDALKSITVGFTKAIVESNAQLEVLQARLEAMSTGIDTFQKMKQVILDLTIRTPFVIKDFIEASVALKAFSVDAVKSLRPISDWAAAIGRDVQDVALAFGKVVTGSPRTALLLSTRGISKAEFEKELKLTLNASQALINIIERRFGGMAENVSNTFTGMLANISDIWFQLSAIIGAPLFDRLSADVRSFYFLIKDQAKEPMLVFKAMATSFGVLYDTVKLFSIAIGSYLVIAIGKAIVSFTAIRNIIESVKASFIALNATISFTTAAITLGFSALVSAFIHQLSYTTELTARIEDLNSAERETAEGSHRRIEALKQTIRTVRDEAESFWGWLKNSSLILSFFRESDADVLKGLTARLEKEKEIADVLERQRLAMVQQVDAVDAYKLKQDIEGKYGGTDLRDKTIERLRKFIGEAKKLPTTGINEEATRKNISAIANAESYLKVLEDTKKTREELSQSAYDEAVSERRLWAIMADSQKAPDEGVHALMESLISLEKQSNKTFSVKDVKDYSDEIAAAKARLFSLLEGDSNIEARIAGRRAALDSLRQQMEMTVKTGFSTTDSVANRIDQYSELIAGAAEKFKLSTDVIKAVMAQESGGRANVVSHAGAKGLMQLMDATAKGLGVEDSFDPKQNIEAGAKYLQQQLVLFKGNLAQALAAYNAGAGNVLKSIKANGDKWLENLGQFTGHHAKETQNYVQSILNILGVSEQQVSKLNSSYIGQQGHFKLILDTLNQQIKLEEDKRALREQQDALDEKEFDLRAKLVRSGFDLNEAQVAYNYSLTGNLDMTYESLDAAMERLQAQKELNAEELRLHSLKEIDKTSAKEMSEFDIRTLELKAQGLAISKEELDIAKKIHELSSRTFGEGFEKAISRLKVTVNNFFDDIASFTVDSIVSGGAGILSDLIFGRQGQADKKITDQIEEARIGLTQLTEERQRQVRASEQLRRGDNETNQDYFDRVQRLAEISGQQADIYTYQSKELELLNKINELEAQRNNLIVDRLKKLGESFIDKTLENLVGKFVGVLFGGGGTTSRLGGRTLQPSAPNFVPPSIGGGSSSSILNTSNRSNSLVIQVNAPIYGDKDFNRMVDSAMQKFSERSSR